MSRLTVYNDSTPEAPVFLSEDAPAITTRLAPIGVQFERWESPVTLSPDDSAEVILAAYKPYLEQLMGAKRGRLGRCAQADAR